MGAGRAEVGSSVEDFGPIMVDDKESLYILHLGVGGTAGRP